MKHRIRIIEELGADIILVINFTGPFAKIRPEEFVKNILIGKLGMRRIYVGENFYFGKGAGAGTAALKKFAGSFSFKIKVIKPVKTGRLVVSSSLIRRLIINGELDKASKLLGRPVSVLGTVVSGSKLARSLGYPTANINPHHEVIPPSGVYAVRIRYGRRLLKGVLNIGVRPTFYSPKDEEPAIEVHIFGFHRGIYGKDLEILFVKKIRDERKYKDRSELMAQIEKDSRAARRILK